MSWRVGLLGAVTCEGAGLFAYKGVRNPPVHIQGFALKGQTIGSSQVAESKSLLLEKQSLWMGWGGHQSRSGKQRRTRTRAVLSPELALL